VVQGFANLFREDKGGRVRMHERLDWKLWNLFLALIPPAGLYAAMVYARRDMDEIVEQGGESFRTTRVSKQQGDPSKGSGRESEAKAVAERLETIDSKVRDLSQRLEESREENRVLQQQVERMRAERKQGWFRIPAVLWPRGRKKEEAEGSDDRREGRNGDDDV